MKPFINDPEHWRQRAEQARSIAGAMTDPQATLSMLRVADEYQKLAQRAEDRILAGAKLNPAA
jgi:hypothetical protein